MSDDYTVVDHELRECDPYAGAKYRMTLRWLGPAEGRRLANIGCGGGLFNRLAVEAGFRVTGYEPDPHAFSLAARDSASSGCEVRNVGLDDIPSRDAADVVVMHDVLEHIADEAGAVTALRRVVAEGGRAVVSVPALPRLYGYHDEMLGHERRYTRRTLRRALEPAFDVLRLRAFGFTLIPLTAYYSKWRRRPYPVAGARGPGPAALAMRAICAVEARVPAPVGTSLLTELAPR